MKKGLIILLLCISCSTPKEIITYRDSTVYHTDTVFVEVPVETVKEVIPVYDTLRMETSVATATAGIDSGFIKGSMENKPIKLEKEILLKEHIVYRDQIKEVEVPVKVEKVVYPRSYGWLLGFIIMIVTAFVARVYYLGI